MASERLRTIVPMFGGATSYVKTLDTIIEEGLNESRVEVQS